jgi:hypothetical protein
MALDRQGIKRVSEAAEARIARGSPCRLEPGRTADVTAWKIEGVQTVETPHRNARGNVVAVQGGDVAYLVEGGARVPGGPLWYEAEMSPGKASTENARTGDVWPSLPAALAAMDAKYGKAAPIDPAPPAKSHAAQIAEAAMEDDPAEGGATCRCGRCGRPCRAGTASIVWPPSSC